MTMTRMEVITAVQRRRRWSRAEKERIVAAALEPGAVASDIARRAGIHVSQLFRWRKELCGSPAPLFTAVRIAPEPSVAPVLGLPPAVVEIEFAVGTRVRLSGAVEPALAAAVLGALTGGRR